MSSAPGQRLISFPLEEGDSALPLQLNLVILGGLPLVVSGVGASTVFDSVDFEDRALLIDDTRDSILSDSQLGERTASQWF